MGGLEVEGWCADEDEDEEDEVLIRTGEGTSFAGWCYVLADEVEEVLGRCC